MKRPIKVRRVNTGEIGPGGALRNKTVPINPTRRHRARKMRVWATRDGKLMPEGFQADLGAEMNPEDGDLVFSSCLLALMWSLGYEVHSGTSLKCDRRIKIWRQA